jgi:hypothetical protein
VADPEGAGVSLASGTAGPASVWLKVAYDGNGLAPNTGRTFDVGVTVTDAHGATASLGVLAITLHPSNYGFSLVAEGADGVLLAGPGARHDADSRDTPIRVTITGTEDAAILQLHIADFVSGPSTLGMAGATVRAFPSAAAAHDHASPLVSAVAGATGHAELDFTATEALLQAVRSQGKVYLTLQQYVPGGQAAGGYSGHVEVGGLAAAP